MVEYVIKRFLPPDFRNILELGQRREYTIYHLLLANNLHGFGGYCTLVGNTPVIRERQQT
ncbi:MAG: hypothetical protein WBF33_39445 [Candidatus Nitrosopolaris sp.]